VRWSGENGLATLIIDRPPLNPLSHQAKAEMLGCLEEIAADHTIRCLILHGAGGRAFSVGADIKEFPDMVARRGVRDHAVQEHTLYNRIDFFPIPTIAAIEGHCLGGGLELALACDLRVASKPRNGFRGEAAFRRRAWRLPRLIGGRARELIYQAAGGRARGLAVAW
jgi:enoyl-CoA hydratase/carnithine racemase